MVASERVYYGCTALYGFTSSPTLLVRAILALGGVCTTDPRHSTGSFTCYSGLLYVPHCIEDEERD